MVILDSFHIFQSEDELIDNVDNRFFPDLRGIDYPIVLQRFYDNYTGDISYKLSSIEKVFEQANKKIDLLRLNIERYLKDIEKLESIFCEGD